MAARVAPQGLRRFMELQARERYTSRPGPRSTTRRSTTRTSSTTRRRSSPKELESLDEVDPSCSHLREARHLAAWSRSACPGVKVAVDAVFDSVSVATTFKDELEKQGIIFCSFSEAVKNHPELVKKYLGSVVPYSDNFFACAQLRGLQRRLLRLHPEGRPLPDGALDLLPDQRGGHGAVRAHAARRRRGRLRELPRGLHGAHARREPAARRRGRARRPRRRRDQVLDRPELVPRRQERQGRHLQLRDQARRLPRQRSKISWTQVETGSAITWKYPSCILQGDDSVGEFYSVAMTNNRQQADTGTKMIHIGKNTTSTIISKGISAGHGHSPTAAWCASGRRPTGARNYSQCDSLLLGDAAARTPSPTSK